MKTCTKCGQTKPLEAFHRRRASDDGREYQCRECFKAYRAAHYESNRETIRARHAEGAERYQAEGAFPIPEELLGRRVRYQSAHARVRLYYGPARSHPCATLGCDRPAEAWALVNPDSPHVHTEWVKDARNPDRPPRRIPYSLNPQDYRPLCHSCHIRLDLHGQNIIEGAAT